MQKEVRKTSTKKKITDCNTPLETDLSVEAFPS